MNRFRFAGQHEDMNHLSRLVAVLGVLAMPSGVSAFMSKQIQAFYDIDPFQSKASVQVKYTLGTYVIPNRGQKRDCVPRD